MNSRNSRIMTACLLLIVLIKPLSADENNINFGLLAGMNVSSNYGIETPLKGIKKDYGGGLFMTKYFIDGNGIRIETLYERKGNLEKIKSNDAFKNVTSKSILHLHYLEMNILGQLVVDVYELPLDILYFGISPAFLLQSYTTIKTGDEVEKEAIEELRRMDLGIVLGTCYAFTKHWKIHARANVGLLNIPDTQAADLKNITFSVLLEYQFSN